MSLVAYAASSDEDSDNEEKNKIVIQTVKKTIESNATINNGENNNKALRLPQPKTMIVEIIEDSELKLNLPQPKNASNSIIEEKDDEFLHKKVATSLIEKPVPLKRPNNKQPIRITIPSLAEFEDNSDVRGKMVKVTANPSKSKSLLGMLPPPKFAAILGKSEMNSLPIETFKKSTPIAKTTSLVPHSVANKLKQNATKPKSNANLMNSSASALSYNNSDESDDDDDSGDFFSLNHEDELPEVSESEINAMVTKKVAQMAKFTANLNKTIQTTIADPQMQINELESEQPSTSKLVQHCDEINIEALIGTRAAKRIKKDDIQFIDISQDEVKLNQEEWLRNQLTQETEFQPTGRLVGDGPGAGTKKKHQITYLAYQAKANEQELQAMWAANRHTRRQTQSKYGF